MEQSFAPAVVVRCSEHELQVFLVGLFSFHSVLVPCQPENVIVGDASLAYDSSKKNSGSIMSFLNEVERKKEEKINSSFYLSPTPN